MLPVDRRFVCLNRRQEAEFLTVKFLPRTRAQKKCPREESASDSRVIHKQELPSVLAYG